MTNEPEPAQCSWCGGEIESVPAPTSVRGEVFCSRSHRDASARAVRRLHERHEELSCWEVSNPSDPYTILAERFEVAAAAVLLVGRGQMGLTPEHEDAEHMPVFLLGGSEEWMADVFGPSRPGKCDGLNRFVLEHGREVADCLDSWTYGGFRKRRYYEKAMAAIDDAASRAEFRARWNDAHSSWNDYASYTARVAAWLRRRDRALAAARGLASAWSEDAETLPDEQRESLLDWVRKLDDWADADTLGMTPSDFARLTEEAA